MLLEIREGNKLMNAINCKGINVTYLYILDYVSYFD